MLKHVIFSVGDPSISTEESDAAFERGEESYCYPLTDIAVTGKAVFMQERDEFWGGDASKDYKSMVVVNPTWQTVCELADEMIEAVGDYHHIFLEEIKPISQDGDVTIYEFSMGS